MVQYIGKYVGETSRNKMKWPEETRDKIKGFEVHFYYLEMSIYQKILKTKVFYGISSGWLVQKGSIGDPILPIMKKLKK